MVESAKKFYYIEYENIISNFLKQKQIVKSYVCVNCKLKRILKRFL